MDSTLEKFARETLKEELKKCTEGECLMFKRMYSHNNLSLPLSEIVDTMSRNQLDWALTQVENTLNKRRKNNGLEKN